LFQLFLGKHSGWQNSCPTSRFLNFPQAGVGNAISRFQFQEYKNPNIGLNVSKHSKILQLSGKKGFSSFKVPKVRVLNCSALALYSWLRSNKSSNKSLDAIFHCFYVQNWACFERFKTLI